ncbi:hypothetical protein ACLOJK_003652 [Asimina triloba]
MEKLLSLSLFLLVLISVLPPNSSAFSQQQQQQNDNEKKTYIIHASKSSIPPTFSHHTLWYQSSLQSVSHSAQIIYTYDTVLHGFSARLTDAEARALRARHGILAVLPELRYHLHTTRTPQFLGLDTSVGAGLSPASTSESDVVIGVLDTGVWPESKSFDDAGLGPVPASWKGECEEGKGFKASTCCNKKLVGARFFAKGYEANFGPVDESRESRSPRDDDGHGTHTASTVAGAAVPAASLFGYATGIARGMAPLARVAAYKVCWAGGCFSSDILAAMEAAIADGVDVLSISLGGSNADYYRDSVGIGAFAAMQRGIFVSCSAGNAGPSAYTLSNVAPWITTVGAGTLDRDFPAYVRLGNGKNFTGVSLYSGKPLPEQPLRLIYAGNATNATSGNLCMMGMLMPEKVAGKIVVCDRGINPRVQKGYAVKEAGGFGMILANTEANREELVADAHLLPAAGVGQSTGNAIKAYALGDPSPTATIVFGGTKVGVQPSPIVSAFSSRGPNAITPEILKPDLIAPGVNILAAWSGALGPTGLPVDGRRVAFNIISGTSMSCPHVSGLAALIKGERPAWSPAAVRSALMTTAYVAYGDGEALQDVATGRAATAFDHGAGHVHPVKALDPGLVYDITAADYLGFLCALNYTSEQIRAVARSNFSCGAGSYAVGDLNYPSFGVVFRGGGAAAETVRHRRSLTNVGAAGTYRARVTMGSEAVKVAVEPEELRFGAENEKKAFVVSFSSAVGAMSKPVFGRLEWSDGKHVVGSPIAVSWM